ncbi:membrane hypothetical protein [Nitrolancea hollandica Lb]|uniref:Pycsar effector protein domain-containing protein n=2 Tax=Nitrolancea hollandica TaxID=1206749 RepID=I4ELR9_9BACT|nr:membrane hypothetical protein [Nitrolancea hollandica Lb]
MSENLDTTLVRIEASYRNLDQVIGWIGNADNKALILLAFHGAVIAGGAAIFPAALQSLLEQLSVWMRILVIGPLVAFGVCFLVSVLRASRAIVPDVTTSEQSIGQHSPFFFGSVAGMTLDDFRARMYALDPKSLEEELIKNTYVIAGIAARKFCDVKAALYFLLLALVFLLVAIVIATVFLVVW